MLEGLSLLVPDEFRLSAHSVGIGDMFKHGRKSLRSSEGLMALLYLKFLQCNSVTAETPSDAFRLSFTVTFSPDKKNIGVGAIPVFSLFPTANPRR